MDKVRTELDNQAPGDTDESIPDTNNNSTDSLPGLSGHGDPSPDPGLVDSDDEDDEGPVTNTPREQVQISPNSHGGQDCLEEELEMNTGMECDDIFQADGNDTDSEEEDYGLNDEIFGYYPSQKRPRIQVDSDPGETEQASRIQNENMDEESGNEGDDEQDNPCEADTETGAKTYMKDGREHVVFPSTGPCYIFLKSNRSKPSTIFRHVNDLLTIFEVLNNDHSVSKKIIKTFFSMTTA